MTNLSDILTDKFKLTLVKSDVNTSPWNKKNTLVNTVTKIMKDGLYKDIVWSETASVSGP
jgi:hypothetical protein